MEECIATTYRHVLFVFVVYILRAYIRGALFSLQEWEVACHMSVSSCANVRQSKSILYVASLPNIGTTSIANQVSWAIPTRLSSLWDCSLQRHLFPWASPNSMHGQFRYLFLLIQLAVVQKWKSTGSTSATGTVLWSLQSWIKVYGMRICGKEFIPTLPHYSQSFGICSSRWNTHLRSYSYVFHWRTLHGRTEIVFSRRPAYRKLSPWLYVSNICCVDTGQL